MLHIFTGFSTAKGVTQSKEKSPSSTLTVGHLVNPSSKPLHHSTKPTATPPILSSMVHRPVLRRSKTWSTRANIGQQSTLWKVPLDVSTRLSRTPTLMIRVRPTCTSHSRHGTIRSTLVISSRPPWQSLVRQVQS